jgi:solute carrier family 6 amino acid transporter-like protein 5/7/9/14
MTAITDQFPAVRKKKMFVCMGICCCLYLLGLPMCTQAGTYWFEIMSYYSGGWSLILIALVESMVFAWVYGASRLVDDIQLMVGFRLYPHWWFCWTFITPIFLLVIFIFNMVDFTPLSYAGVVMPDWSQAVGWLMAVSSVALIPVFAVFKIWKSYKKPDYEGLTFLRRLQKLTQPTAKWRPADKEARRALAHGIGQPSTLPPKLSVDLRYMTSIKHDDTEPDFSSVVTKHADDDSNSSKRGDDNKSVSSGHSGHSNPGFQDDFPTSQL